jgi:tRNA(fMet)-specific endonuclease VapC
MKMNGSIIDTNVIIKMMHNESDALNLLQKVTKSYISIIVKGELYYGAYKSSQRDENLTLFRKILSKFEILPIDGEEIPLAYALIKSDLRKQGKKIPENDLWIAATAHVYGLSVATFDTHFSYINQIQLAPHT